MPTIFLRCLPERTRWSAVDDPARPVQLVLASASPRREQLLGLLGLPFVVQPADIDETPQLGELAEALVIRLASRKAETVAARTPRAIVIGADTVVVVDHHILGKPTDESDARWMLGLLSGRSHRVLTGIAVAAGGRTASALEETSVTFDGLSQRDIDWYLASREHQGKAGGYAIQGVAGTFITRLEGSFTGAVGLPLTTLRPMLVNAGL